MISQRITVSIGGKTGVGKSSIVNALTGSNLPISHIKPCTNQISASEYKYNNLSTSIDITFHDLPGLGSLLKTDKTVVPLYIEELRKCDLFLYLLKADTRYISYDQKYFLSHFLPAVPSLESKIIICLNQVDKIYPGNWNRVQNSPSNEQLENIKSRVGDVGKRLDMIFPQRAAIPILLASAIYNYKCETILQTIMRVP